MEVLDVCLDMPAIIFPTIITMIVFPMMKVLKGLQVMEDVDIGILRPSTLPLSIMYFIIAMTLADVDIGINRSVTLPL